MADKNKYKHHVGDVKVLVVGDDYTSDDYHDKDKVRLIQGADVDGHSYWLRSTPEERLSVGELIAARCVHTSLSYSDWKRISDE